MKILLLPTTFACAALLSGCGLDVMYADWKVDQLCKKDGGVKVFVTDAPPVEFRKPDGNIDLNGLERAKPGQTYYLSGGWTIIQPDDPRIVRSEANLIRGRDQVVLGTSVAYFRPTQNVGVPFLSRESHICPQGGTLDPLVQGVFFPGRPAK